MSAIANITSRPSKKNQIRLQQRQRRGRKCQVDSPANDVSYEVNCPAAALTFYKFKPQPFLLDEQVITGVEANAQRLFDEAVLDSVSSQLKMVNNLFQSGMIDNAEMVEGMNHLRSGDIVQLQNWVTTVFATAKETLITKVMTEAKSLVTSLPFGESIWEKLSGSKLYGFHYFSDVSTDLQLRYCSLDFFAHYQIDANTLKEPTQKLYYALLNKLMAFGDGAWQQDISTYGQWCFSVPESQQEMEQIESFVESFRCSEIAEVKELLNGQPQCIQSFLGTIDESCFTDLDSLLESDDDGEFEAYKESAEEGLQFLRAEFLCKKLGINGSRLSWADLAELQAAIVDDGCKTLQLLKGVLSNSSLFNEDEQSRTTRGDVLSYVDETHPGFGIVLCPFAENSPEDLAFHQLSENMYQQFMEMGEAEDWWIVNTSHAAWLDVMLTRIKATALLMYLVLGHTVVLSEQP